MDREAAATLIDALGARRGIVAVVGAGGKKSTLYRLLEAHRTLGTKRLLLTSTVQTAAAPTALNVPTIIINSHDAAAAIAETKGRDGAWLIAGPSNKPDRLSGLSADLVASLHRQGAFALSLVKADGARMRMIKAPGTDEPALPDDVTTILPIVSARVFGRPLSEKLSHRPERLSDIIEAVWGTEIDAIHVAKLLSSPKAALKNAGTASLVPIINMVDSSKRLAQAREAALKALSMTERFDRVALVSMRAPSPLIEVVRQR